jgi:hypothetical protein
MQKRIQQRDESGDGVFPLLVRLSWHSLDQWRGEEATLLKKHLGRQPVTVFARIRHNLEHDVLRGIRQKNREEDGHGELGGRGILDERSRLREANSQLFAEGLDARP